LKLDVITSTSYGGEEEGEGRIDGKMEGKGERE